MPLNKIVGNSVLVVGDLHISDKYTGKHKDYLSNCFKVLNDITAKLELEKPCALFLLGDIVGLRETNIGSREVLSNFCKVLKYWNSICPVYSVRGNHDMAGYPDFKLLEDLDLIITSEKCGGYVDYYAKEDVDCPELRFHLVDYGSEHRDLNIWALSAEELALAEEQGVKPKTASNIVLGHANYTIEGVTTWYRADGGIELNTLSNFKDVDFVISGHIHSPSNTINCVNMFGGKPSMLFYPGCPTRPSVKDNTQDSCYFVVLKYSPELDATNVNIDEWKLAPSSEVFYKDEHFVQEQTSEEAERKAALTDVLNDMMQYRLSSGDPIKQVELVPNASKEAKDIAIDYLKMAINIV